MRLMGCLMDCLIALESCWQLCAVCVIAYKTLFCKWRYGCYWVLCVEGCRCGSCTVAVSDYTGDRLLFYLRGVGLFKISIRDRRIVMGVISIISDFLIILFVIVFIMSNITIYITIHITITIPITITRMNIINIDINIHITDRISSISSLIRSV